MDARTLAAKILDLTTDREWLAISSQTEHIRIVAEIISEAQSEKEPDLHYTNEAYAINYCKSVAEIIERLKNFAILAIEKSHSHSWIKITDDPQTLPEIDDTVFIAYGEGPWRQIARFSYGMDNKPEWSFLGTQAGLGQAWNVTHWQPLPAPPPES